MKSTCVITVVAWPEPLAEFGVHNGAAAATRTHAAARKSVQLGSVRQAGTSSGSITPVRPARHQYARLVHVARLRSSASRSTPRDRQPATSAGGNDRRESATVRPRGVTSGSDTGVSYYQDAVTYETRRRARPLRGPAEGVNHKAVEAAEAVEARTEPLSPGLVARFKADRLWHLKEFSGTAVPAGRQDAVQLRTWLTAE